MQTNMGGAGSSFSAAGCVLGGESGFGSVEVMLSSEAKPLVPGLRQRDGASDAIAHGASSSDGGSNGSPPDTDCEQQESGDRPSVELHQLPHLATGLPTKPPTRSGRRSDSRRSDTRRSDSRRSDSVRRSEWYNSAMVITGEVMGTGVLALPHALSKLGWALGLTMSVLVGLVAIQMGLFLSRVRERHFPFCTSYASLATATVGPKFRRFTGGLISLNWALLLP